MDHGWITHQTMLTPPYMAGVNQFMESAPPHNNGAEDMLCPCRNCGNGIRKTIDVVKCYWYAQVLYDVWIYHGESVYIDAHNYTANDDGYESDDSDDFELYKKSLFD